MGMQQTLLADHAFVLDSEVHVVVLAGFLELMES
jgi:hypothetical protein